MRNRNYRNLTVWNRSIEQAIEVYRLTEGFPATEKFGLVTQMRRSSVSIPSNLAEGSKRTSPKEFARFVQISLGSGAELETQLIISRRLGYVVEKTFTDVSEGLAEIMRMLDGLQKKLDDMV